MLRQLREIPMIVTIQVLLALGVVYGMSFLLPDIDPQSALFLTTGAPTLSLMILGIVVVTQEVARSKATGREEYLRALPISPLAVLAATVTFWLLANLPGTALALWVARLRFDIDLDVTAYVVPIMALVALTSASVGYALAQSMSPQAAQQTTQLLSVGLLLFSPINYPLERLPSVMQDIHQWLPITHMADLIRWSLTGDITGSVGTSIAIVTAWCAGGLWLSYRAATRRR
jgi:ABC-2 type transport system permease protein